MFPKKRVYYIEIFSWNDYNGRFCGNPNVSVLYSNRRILYKNCIK